MNVTDRDDYGTGNWEAKYFISNDPGGNFAIITDPNTNQGIVSVVKVQSDHLLLTGNVLNVPQSVYLDVRMTV